MAAPLFHTAEMVRQLPDDGNRYEVVRGELLVTPAPRAAHQRAVMRLIEQLLPYLRAHPVGELFPSPADISWGPDILVQPDLFVVRMDEARRSEWQHMRHLLLAIEVLSPASARADRFAKRRLYQEVGVPMYWVVDVEQRTVEVWTPEATFPVFERERLTWQPEGAREPLTIACDEVFRVL